MTKMNGTDRFGRPLSPEKQRDIDDFKRREELKQHQLSQR